MKTQEEQHLIHLAAERIADRHPEIARDVVSNTVARVQQRFDDSRIRSFVPLLVERKAEAELSARALSR